MIPQHMFLLKIKQNINSSGTEISGLIISDYSHLCISLNADMILLYLLSVAVDGTTTGSHELETSGHGESYTRTRGSM